MVAGLAVLSPGTKACRSHPAHLPRCWSTYSCSSESCSSAIVARTSSCARSRSSSAWHGEGVSHRARQCEKGLSQLCLLPGCHGRSPGASGGSGPRRQLPGPCEEREGQAAGPASSQVLTDDLAQVGALRSLTCLLGARSGQHAPSCPLNPAWPFELSVSTWGQGNPGPAAHRLLTEG